MRLRAKPNGDIYSEYCINGIYDVLDAEISGNYNWYKIAEIDGNEFWIAFSDSWATDLPVYNPQDIIEILEKEVSNLNAKIANAIKELILFCLYHISLRMDLLYNFFVGVICYE